jgi:hypothetical protein
VTPLLQRDEAELSSAYQEVASLQQQLAEQQQHCLQQRQAMQDALARCGLCKAPVLAEGWLRHDVQLALGCWGGLCACVRACVQQGATW